MNLGRYFKSLIPSSGGLIAVLQDWAVTGKVDVPHLRLALFLEVIAFLVYLFPNAPVPTPSIELTSLAEPVKYASGGFTGSAPGVTASDVVVRDGIRTQSFTPTPPADGEATRSATGHGLTP